MSTSFRCKILSFALLPCVNYIPVYIHVLVFSFAVNKYFIYGTWKNGAKTAHIRITLTSLKCDYRIILACIHKFVS